MRSDFRARRDARPRPSETLRDRCPAAIDRRRHKGELMTTMPVANETFVVACTACLKRLRLLLFVRRFAVLHLVHPPVDEVARRFGGLGLGTALFHIRDDSAQPLRPLD